MTTVRNVAREKLEQGHLSLGVGIRTTRSVEIGKMMATAGFDWLFLDMEHGTMSLDDAVTTLNAANLTVVMLETPTAIANAAEIAAVPGVDVLLIGSNDLCAEMGIPGDFGNDRLAEAYGAMIAACEKHRKFPGMAGIYNETIMPRYIEMGARFILSGQDASFMMAGAQSRTGFLRKTLGK
jgi:4-hydroxy-2-oxoheptanedioate aldolase